MENGILWTKDQLNNMLETRDTIRVIMDEGASYITLWHTVVVLLLIHTNLLDCIVEAVLCNNTKFKHKQNHTILSNYQIINITALQ